MPPPEIKAIVGQIEKIIGRVDRSADEREKRNTEQQKEIATAVQSLKSSHVDQAEEHAEAIKRLQAEYDRIQSRIQAMYVDKLDAKADPGMFEHLSADWRKQQDRCLREIERRQSADQHYLEEGVTILEMARNAQRLFDSEEPMQKRRLLNFVVSNSAWANGELKANLREPFGFIAEMAEIHFRRRFFKRGKLRRSFWLAGV